MTRLHTAVVMGLLLGAVAGCAQPSGPVLGEWRGQQPISSFINAKQIDLTLSGAADAQSGSYYVTSLLADPTSRVGHDQQDWGGTWVRGQTTQNGQVLTTITLQDILPDIIGSYALLPDNTLHALDPHGRLDTSPAGALYTLHPVAPRHAV